MMHRVFPAAVTLLIAFALTIGCAQKPAEEDLFIQAKKAQEARDFYAAVEAYKSVVKFYPKGERADEAQFMVGFIYANEIQDTAKAKEAYQAYLDKYSAASDSGMVLSARWELANLGRDIEDIEEVMQFARKNMGESTPEADSAEVK